jgi:Plasmid pRiA4b ORF-3-like protein
MDSARDGKLYQLLITLRYVADPPVWRRVVVPGGIVLGQLHVVIQDGMGWEDCHLHMFRAGKGTYGVPDGDFMSDRQDEDAVRLSDLLSRKGQKLIYTYDFGDHWDHMVELEKTFLPDSKDAIAIGPVPACLAGQGACPPEDCGGAGGYENLREILADPGHDEHEDTLYWLGLAEPDDFDPAEFQLAEINERLRELRGIGEPSRLI